MPLQPFRCFWARWFFTIFEISTYKCNIIIVVVVVVIIIIIIIIIVIIIMSPRVTGGLIVFGALLPPFPPPLPFCQHISTFWENPEANFFKPLKVTKLPKRGAIYFVPTIKRTAHPTTTKLGRCTPLIMLSTWLNCGEILPKCSFLSIFFVRF